MRAESYRVIAAALIASLPVALAWAQDAVPVAVVSPRPAQVTDQLRLTGTLTAERSARLSPRVDGLVARVRVDAGDRVKAGAALIELDSAVASLALERSKAGTAEARARSDEANRLAAAALVASEAFEREQAELVRRHTVPAPFAGVVARLDHFQQRRRHAQRQRGHRGA